MSNLLHVGLDVGSTTVKIVVMNDKLKTIYSNYTRHFSDTKNTIYDVLNKLIKDYPNSSFTMNLTGSGALEIANLLDIPFIQEVISCKKAVEKYIPKTDVVIELGGEDAKIIYFDQTIEITKETKPACPTGIPKSKRIVGQAAPNIPSGSPKLIKAI